MRDVTNEFEFLQGDAKRVRYEGQLPLVTREYFTAESGRKISFLRYVFDSEKNIKNVFLHGAGLNAHSYDPTVLALGVSSVSIDLPGHGKSDWRKDATYSPTTIEADVAEAIGFVASAPINLIGQSLGGLTAAAIIAKHPDIAKTLTIIDISPGIKPQRDAGSISEFISGKKEFRSIAEMVDRAIEFQIGHDREALTRGVTLNTRQRADGLYEWTHHFAHLDGFASSTTSDPDQFPYASLWQPLRESSIPINLVRGSDGMISSDLLEQWQQKLPTSKTFTVRGGHNLHEHNPYDLAEVLREITL